jgi:hypothetical protein
LTVAAVVGVKSLLQDAFYEKHGVKLGFMSAFVKAAASALQEVPAVNGVIDGQEIIYRCASSTSCWCCCGSSTVSEATALQLASAAAPGQRVLLGGAVQRCSCYSCISAAASLLQRGEEARAEVLTMAWVRLEHSCWCGSVHPVWFCAGTTLTSPLQWPLPRAWWFQCCAAWTSSALQRWRRCVCTRVCQLLQWGVAALGWVQEGCGAVGGGGGGGSAGWASTNLQRWKRRVGAGKDCCAVRCHCGDVAVMEHDCKSYVQYVFECHLETK